jgi:hypothetical protein
MSTDNNTFTITLTEDDRRAILLALSQRQGKFFEAIEEFPEEEAALRVYHDHLERLRDKFKKKFTNQHPTT